FDEKIVGGTPANIVNYSYQVSLLRNNIHYCGGAIISSTWILTAAHCVVGGLISAFSIRAGSSSINSGGQIIAASRILFHARYRRRLLDYDIALIQLVSPITIRNASSIPLVPSGTGPATGAIATVTGWGDLTEGGNVSATLRVVQVPIISQANCRAAYNRTIVTDRMFCAGVLGIGGKDACQGDSGGPVVIGAAPPQTYVDHPMLDGRIVGGTATTIEEYPFIASLLRSNSHICGAVIISELWLITAAHCVTSGSVSSYSVRGGSTTRNSGGQVVAVTRILGHANYDSRTTDYDVAALQIASAFTIANAVPIGIVSSGIGPPAGAITTILGWGALSEGGQLQQFFKEWRSQL
ncbi:hypothetical protein NQ314_014335, partial [Rhamnusium bicolor]